MIKKKIVYVQGTWDLFHFGHVRILRKASKLANTLIAGINTDESVKKHKGDYPVVSLRDRIIVLEACQYVDMVIESDLTIDAKKLKDFAVDILVLGSDWKDKKLPGLEDAKKFLEVIYFPYTEGVSTTDIRNGKHKKS